MTRGLQPWQRWALWAWLLPLLAGAQTRPPAALPARTPAPAEAPAAPQPDGKTTVSRAVVASAKPVAPASPLQADSASFDFGQVRQGAMVRHSFVLRNTGRTSLIIQQVRTSCGCATGRAPSQAIDPGQTAELDVAFHTGGRLGPQDKTVTVVAAGAPPLVLRLTGVVTSAVLPLTQE